MAMTMTGEVTLPAERAQVWAMLNDPVVLKACIPGCQSLDKTSDSSFSAVAKIKIGPVGASFKGKVQLSESRIADVAWGLQRIHPTPRRVEGRHVRRSSPNELSEYPSNARGYRHGHACNQ
jgi:carbon monoxide dehydrogenase subunit G (CoxG)